MRATPLVSMLFVPASQSDKLSKIPLLPGSAVILDLEDAVAHSMKATARENAANAIQAHGSEKPIWVRVNGLETGLLETDLASIVRPGLAGVDLPKVESPEEIHRLSRVLSELEQAAGMAQQAVKVMATIETAKGVGSVDAIAAAADARLECLGFGTGDFCLDVGIETDSSSPTVIAAKIAVVMASRRAGLNQPHDSVYINFKDPEGLETDTRLGKRLGFFGKHAIHPSQVEVIERVYLPTAAEVEKARRLLAAFEEAEREGKGAIGFDGELVDYPLAERSRRLLALAEASSGPGEQP